MVWFFYKVAEACEYLAVTGHGIEDVKVTKMAWCLPGRSCRRFTILPINYSFSVNAQSANSMPLLLDMNLTIGPRDDPADLKLFAKLLLPPSHMNISSTIKRIVQNIVEVEVWDLTYFMALQTTAKGFKEFREELIDKVQLQLNQFGLRLYTANITGLEHDVARGECVSKVEPKLDKLMQLEDNKLYRKKRKADED